MLKGSFCCAPIRLHCKVGIGLSSMNQQILFNAAALRMAKDPARRGAMRSVCSPSGKGHKHDQEVGSLPVFGPHCFTLLTAPMCTANSEIFCAPPSNNGARDDLAAVRTARIRRDTRCGHQRLCLAAGFRGVLHPRLRGLGALG